VRSHFTGVASAAAAEAALRSTITALQREADTRIRLVEDIRADLTELVRDRDIRAQEDHTREAEAAREAETRTRIRNKHNNERLAVIAKIESEGEPRVQEYASLSAVQCEAYLVNLYNVEPRNFRSMRVAEKIALLVQLHGEGGAGGDRTGGSSSGPMVECLARTGVRRVGPADYAHGIRGCQGNALSL
jgi:hypothetical protein